MGIGRISIRGRLEEGAKQIVIVVEDDGHGLSAESMEVVFQIGERLDEQVPGSGLGLPIVRDLARLYGGEIHLEHSVKGRFEGRPTIASSGHLPCLMTPLRNPALRCVVTIPNLFDITYRRRKAGFLSGVIKHGRCPLEAIVGRPSNRL